MSGRLALEHARRRLAVGAPFVVESLLGARFTGRILRTETIGSLPTVIPEVEGTAYLTGRSDLIVAPDDPLQTGFLLR